MRILLDEAELGWDRAWDITQRTFAYTNHTLLPEALERWPVAWFEDILPRHLEIIYEINRRFLDRVRGRYPGDTGRLQRMSLIEEGPGKKVRMANLAIVGSHSTNGVAAIHTDLLKAHVVPDFAQMFPERFSNKTNGVTQRRWLYVANPSLPALITEAIGDGWIADFSADRAAEAARRRRRIPRRIPRRQARGAAALYRLAECDNRPDRRPGHHLRQPDQAHPRIQAPVAECAAHRDALQPAAPRSQHRGPVAHILLRGQGRAGLSSGEADHQIHQQSFALCWIAIPSRAAGSRLFSCPTTACPWPSG